MTHAHVCDECKTVAPINEAIGWWSLEAIGLATTLVGEKREYHFCSWRCAAATTQRIAGHRQGLWAPPPTKGAA